jgi:hypothetical protein
MTMENMTGLRIPPWRRIRLTRNGRVVGKFAGDSQRPTRGVASTGMVVLQQDGDYDACGDRESPIHCKLKGTPSS